MAYSDWVSKSKPAVAPQASYYPGGFPIDARTLQDSFSDVLGIVASNRHPGLRVYDTSSGKEYVFASSVNQFGVITFPNTAVREYHPELAHFKAVQSLSVPANLVQELGGSVTIDGTVYNVIPEGAEGIIKTSDSKYYKYVWNGSDWVEYSNLGSGSGSGSSTNIDVSGLILNFSYVSDSLSSINDLTTALISSKYAATFPNSSLVAGTEINVVYTDDSDANNPVEYCRKYIYLNSAWYIVQGVQEYSITLPQYSTWEAGSSIVLSGVPDIEIKQTDTQGMVDVIISHQFNSQYIDAFVFQESLTDTDLDYDDVVDEYGDRILAPVLCFKSKKDGKYKVKTTLPISDSFATKYSITLQK